MPTTVAGDLVFHALLWHGGDKQTAQQGEDEEDGDLGGGRRGGDRRRKAAGPRGEALPPPPWAAEHAFEVDVYGKTADGESVCVHVPFRPCFYVEVRDVVEAAAMADRVKRGLSRTMQREFVGHNVQRKRSFVGFSPPESPALFCQLVFQSLRARRRASAVLAEQLPGACQYEPNVDPVVRLLHVRDLKPCGWVCVTQAVKVPFHGTETTCGVELRASVPNLAAAAAPGPCPSPLVVASFDIECHSAEGGFPDPSQPGDVIIAICTAFQRPGDPRPYRRVAVTLGEVARPPEDPEEQAPAPAAAVELACVPDEATLLARWAGLLAEERADVVCGYNVWGFDMRYIHARCVRNGGVLNGVLAGFARHIGRAADARLALVDKRMSSSNTQTHEVQLLDTPGVLQVDLYYHLKKFNRFDSYKLDAVGREVLGEGKADLPIKRMQEIWRSGGAAAKWEIVRYCMQDTELVLHLMDRMTVLPFVFEMANACSVSPDAVLLNGQQVRVFSLLLRKTRAAGMLCPAPPPSHQPQQQQPVAAAQRPAAAKKRKEAEEEEEEEAEDGDDGPGGEGEAAAVAAPGLILKGATVLEPIKGAYFTPIACLDFQSLYPNIIMSHNLCHSTLVRGGAAAAPPAPLRCEEVGGVRVVPATTARGILPALLEELGRLRTEAKADMAAAEARGDAFGRQVHHAKQLAFKVTMNSVYGFCGASRGGMLPCMEIASAVTAVGRGMIAATKEFVEREYAPARVVYGDTDSVMIQFCGGAGAAALPAEEAARLGREAAARATALFRAPIKLCFEKCYKPYLLFSKKRYDTCQRVLHAVLHDMDVAAARRVVQERARELLAGHVHLEALSMTKAIKVGARRLLDDQDRRCTRCTGACALTDEARKVLTCRQCGDARELAYKCAPTPAVAVATKMERRMPGGGPKAGDAVQFVYVVEPQDAPSSSSKRCPKAAAAPRAEDVAYAQLHALTPDYRFYIDHQLKNVLVEVFRLLLPAGTNVEKELFGEVLLEHQHRVDRQRPITAFLRG